MRLLDSTRVWGLLCACGICLGLIFWCPQQGGAPTPRTTVPSVQAQRRAAQALCGLLVQPPPQMSAVVRWSAELPDLPVSEPPRTQVVVAVLHPALAGLGRTVSDAISDRPTNAQFVANRPSIGGNPGDLTLKPSDLDPREPLSSGELMSSHWQRPVVLLAQLESLTHYSECADWASDVAADIEQLTASGPLSLDQRQQILARLVDTSEQVELLAGRVEAASTLTLLRRTQHSLSRRLDIWQAIHRIELRAASEPNLAAAQPHRLAHCLAGVMALTETGVGPDWRKYLLIETLDSLANDRENEAAKKKQLAKSVLERLAYARWKLNQPAYLTQGPMAALDDELRYWAAEPVDISNLLAQLEGFEQTGLPSLAHQVADDRRRLSLSPIAEQRALAEQIDSHYRNCNVRLSFNEALVNRFVPQRKAVDAPVVETILGLPVRGQSTTTSQLVVKLVPGSQRLRLVLEANGQIASSTHSTSGSVTVYTDSDSTYSARKVLELDGAGAHSEPAEVEAYTNSRLRCIGTEYDGVPLVGSIVQDYAKDQYQERREAARREAQRKVSAQARAAIDALAEAQVKQLYGQFDARINEPLKRLSLTPTLVEAKAENSRFTLRARLAGQHQLAAHTPRPRALSDSLISLQLHESAVNNIVDQLDLDGGTFTVAQLRERIEQKLNWPGLLKADPDNDDSELTFAERDAVRVRCENGRLVFTLAIEKLQSGSRSWKNFTVGVMYKPLVVGNTVELARDGTISLKADRLSMQSQFVLRGTFSRIFSDDRNLPLLAEQLKSDPRLAGLQITQFIIEDGWLGLAIGPKRTAALAR